jgi:hypothetical protein
MGGKGGNYYFVASLPFVSQTGKICSIDFEKNKIGDE